MGTNIKVKDAFYAALGVADTAFERAKSVAGGARTYADKNRDPKTFVQTSAKDVRTYVSGRAGELQKHLGKRRQNASRTYNRLARRGQTLLTRVRRQATTKRAADEIRSAQRQAPARITRTT